MAEVDAITIIAESLKAQVILEKKKTENFFCFVDVVVYSRSTHQKHHPFIQTQIFEQSSHKNQLYQSDFDIIFGDKKIYWQDYLKADYE